MQKRLNPLKNKITKLPKKPGVYIFRDSTGHIIYIGKALSLKNRVSSYFQKGSKEPKTSELVANITDLQTIVVNSEFEALLLEAKLIKQHKPKYNVQLRDDKSYLYIVVCKEFPNRIYPSRRPELENKLLDWYGPFPSGKDVREILRIIRRIFPYRSCAKLHKTPCLYFHLNLCPGMCKDCFSTGQRIATTEETDYQKTITQIRQLLSGKTSSLIKNFEKEMKILVKESKFEEAQKVKDRIDALIRITQGWKSTPIEYRENTKALEEIKDLLIKYGGINPLAINKIEGYDVSNLSSQIIVGSMVTFVNGEPEKSSYRKFNLKGYFDFTNQSIYNSQDDPEGIKQILKRRLNHPEWILPQLILIDGGKSQVGAAFSALKEKNLENQIAILGLTKEEEVIVLPQIKNGRISSWKTLHLSRKSPALQLLQAIRDESHRFAQKYYRSKYAKNLLTGGDF